MGTYLDLDGEDLSYAYTLDKAALDITGDIDIRIDIALSDWTPAADATIAAKFDSSGNQRAWQLVVNTAGNLALQSSANGSTSVSGITSGGPLSSLGAYERICLRATLDVDNGSSGRVNGFYSGPTLDGPWTVLREQTQTGTTGLFDSSANLAIGAQSNGTSQNTIARVYGFRLYDGINGTLVANPNFGTWVPGQSTMNDQKGNAWVRSGTGSTIVDDGEFTVGSLEALNDLSQEKYGVDLNRGVQLASGIRKDINGVAHELWGGREAHARRDQIKALLEGGEVAEESAPPPPTDGMTLVFEDDFDTFNDELWVPHPWFASSFRWDGVTVEDSILKLQVNDDMSPTPPSVALTTLGTRDPDNIPHHPNALAWMDGGYFECRMRFTRHEDAYPAFWMLGLSDPNNFPDGDECPFVRCEWDIVEQVGFPMTRSHMNVHRSNASVCEVEASFVFRIAEFGDQVDLSEWHTWGGLWKDGILTQYLDGVPLMQAPVPDTFNQPMYLILHCDRRDNYQDLPVMDVWFDWVRVWQ